MKKRTSRLEQLYKKLKRELTDSAIYDLVISDSKKDIKYNPNYQRNYIWNITKAVNLIETVLINGEIPPLTVIKKDNKIEIVDGRQRYETLLQFYRNEFPLKICGLEKLKELDGLYYKDLPENVRKIFAEYKLKMIIYTADDLSISDEDLELVRRDLFRRHNYGMTSLSRSETARAKYLYDDITIKLVELFEKDNVIYNQCIEVLLSKTKRNLDDREKRNLLLVAIREVLIMPYIPIIGEKSIRVGASIFDRYYATFITNLSEKEKSEKVDEFVKIFKKLYLIKGKLNESNNQLKDNVLFFKSTYWMLAILYKVHSNEFYSFNVNQFCHYVENGGQNYFDNYKNITPESIESRHSYMKKYIDEELKLDISDYIYNIKNNKKSIQYKKDGKIKSDENWNGIGSNRQVMTVRDTLKMSEIIRLIKENRFIIRPEFQRTEVKSRKKASKIIESIILGVKLPPIYVYVTREEDGLDRYTVLDGQQRLISILKFMGEPITDENFNYIKTYKDKYALCGLKDFEDLNGKVYEEGENSINQFKREPIKNYELEVIKIDKQANPRFDSVDMFLRLNQNPCPISVNTFEMWNSFDIINSLNKIKEIAKYNLFKQYGNKMKEEELVTTLAYMNYKGINIENMNNFLSVYMYLENKDKQGEHYEVKLSIPNKEAITNFLEDLEPDSDEESKFLNSIESVNSFVEKLKILSEDDENILIRIFNPHIKIPRKGNKKDFYITWLILQELDTHIIKTYKEEILGELEEVFKLMKNMPNNRDEKSFINYIKNVINEYSKHTSKGV